MSKKPWDNFKQLFGLDNPEGAGIENDFDFENNRDSSTEINNISDTPSHSHIVTSSNKPISLETEMGNSNYQTIFLDPKTFSDCRKIVDYIRADKMVTLNLEYLDEQTAIRLMNFLSGAMTVKDANYLIISKKVYTVVPKSMKVYYEGKKIINPRIFNDFGGDDR